MHLFYQLLIMPDLMMATKRCMNGGCCARSAAGEWRRGWPLRSGGFAALCDKCGKAYEQSVFCDLFHQNESGWRECLCCGKHLHCGCVASKSLVELVDGGGVQCINCTMNSVPFISSETTQVLVPQPSQRVLPLNARNLKDERVNDDFNALLAGSSCELQELSTSYRIDEDAICKGKAIQSGENIELNGQNMFLSQRESLDGSFDHIKWEQMTHLTRQALSISLRNSNQSTFMEPILNAVKDGRDQNKMASALQQAQRAGHLLPKAPQKGPVTALEASKETVSQMRVARPPAEGRGRNQLLPRYWPRITDQELRQISGDSNSTIVPLFEKVLSASDAGRIGRLVLPKACAEAYFPPISQAEGLPLKIQDAKGKEWHFQFRFWPNNNSRMYVLEGVTPCIQSLQLQAGDTVTFSRMDPEGKLIMGFRKATNAVPLQDSQITAIANAGLGNETFFSGISENLSMANGYPGFFQSLKGAPDPRLSYLTENLNSADNARWQKTDKHGGPLNEGFLMQPILVQENKRSCNIGGKSKRLHMDNEEALELKLSWEEAQDLLRPPPSAKPSVVMIEDQEFEEYEEPPVFGKRTIFTSRSCGDQDQWVQCDDCFKWRRLPVDVLVPSNWTCADNTWDPTRSSCSAPDKLSSTDIQNLLRQNTEIRRQWTSTSSNHNPEEVEVPDLDAALGDSTHQATTKHPRHRPGCTCIVCIQPPSGKGPKHHPNCVCNVCMTVKRRFKTLMMRRKKRQSEREEAEANKRLEGNANIVDRIDLNFQPKKNENYLTQNDLASLVCEQLASSSSMVPQAKPVEEKTPDEEGSGDNVKSDAF